MISSYFCNICEHPQVFLNISGIALEPPLHEKKYFSTSSTALPPSQKHWSDIGGRVILFDSAIYYLFFFLSLSLYCFWWWWWQALLHPHLLLLLLFLFLFNSSWAAHIVFYYCGNRPNKRNPSPDMTLVVHDLITMQLLLLLLLLLHLVLDGPWISFQLFLCPDHSSTCCFLAAWPVLLVDGGWWWLSIRVGIIMSFILHRIYYTRVVAWRLDGQEDAVMIGIIIAILLNRVALNGIIMTHLLHWRGQWSSFGQLELQCSCLWMWTEWTCGRQQQRRKCHSMGDAWTSHGNSESDVALNGDLNY